MGFYEMNVTIRNKIFVEDPTPEMLAYCKSTLSFPNPEYLKKEALGKWTGNTQREIVLYERAGNRLALPFGTIREVYKRFKNDITAFKVDIRPVEPRDYGSGINL